jgi:hypothetical protein
MSTFAYTTLPSFSRIFCISDFPFHCNIRTIRPLNGGCNSINQKITHHELIIISGTNDGWMMKKAT